MPGRSILWTSHRARGSVLFGLGYWIQREYRAQPHRNLALMFANGLHRVPCTAVPVDSDHSW